MKMRSIQVLKTDQGQRVDKYIRKYLNNAPLSLIYKLFRKKDIKVNGKRVDINYKYAFWELYDKEIYPAEREGLSATVYTQLTDVEDELNGLITYDRRVIKISPVEVKGIVGNLR